MKKLYLFTLISLVFLSVSCNKNNAVNPNSTKNAIPISSIITSLPTASGNVLLVGNVLPLMSVGAVGDFYLDVTNGFIYGPKTSTTWGTGYSLQGPTGTTGNTGNTGAAGSQIYSGTGVPATTLGANGDYYLDKTNLLLYGPKTAANGWGTPVSLAGPKGPVGPQGPQGPAGGASNVKVDVFSLGGSSWLWNSQYVFETSSGSYTEYFTRYYVRLNNTVTQDVLDNGMVLVYFTPSPINNPNQWAPLAYQFDSSFGYTYNYVFVPAVGQVTLHYFFIQTDPTATLPTLSTYNDENRKFKIVTITGQTGTFMMAHHVNLNNYQEVSKVTGLWQQDIVNNK
jgi:hypothetical protein